MFTMGFHGSQHAPSPLGGVSQVDIEDRRETQKLQQPLNDEARRFSILEHL